MLRKFGAIGAKWQKSPSLIFFSLCQIKSTPNLIIFSLHQIKSMAKKTFFLIKKLKFAFTLLIFLTEFLVCRTKQRFLSMFMIKKERKKAIKTQIKY